MKKPETKFRENRIYPFLDTLKNTVTLSIQQKTICGDPDLILCCRGLFVALELKVDSPLEPLQKYKLDLIRSKGHGISFVVTPKNFEEVKSILEKLDGGNYDNDEIPRIEQ